MNAYDTWIAAFREQCGGHLLGKCEAAVKAMIVAFPELSIVRGHVHDGRYGKRAHWWLTAADGQIVDPTSGQFPALLEYEPWAPGDEVRVGRCMSCGEDIYRAVQSLDAEPRQECICGDECARAFEAYLNDPHR